MANLKVNVFMIRLHGVYIGDEWQITNKVQITLEVFLDRLYLLDELVMAAGQPSLRGHEHLCYHDDSHLLLVLCGHFEHGPVARDDVVGHSEDADSTLFLDFGLLARGLP